MAADLAPEWASSTKEGAYRIVVEGDPNMTLEFFPGRDESSVMYEGLVVTAMRGLNAIPYLAGKTGLFTSLVLPWALPHDIFRSDNTIPNMKGMGG